MSLFPIFSQLKAAFLKRVFWETGGLNGEKVLFQPGAVIVPAPSLMPQCGSFSWNPDLIQILLQI